MDVALVAMEQTNRLRGFTDRESIMHARCDNWGRAMSGGLMGAPIPDEARPEPDLLDADIIEQAMCVMRQEKHLHYKLFRYLYLANRSMVEASNYFRKSEWWVRCRRKEGLGYLIRHFEKEKNQLQSIA